MIANPTTNLADFDDQPCAFDQGRSEINTLPGHQVSFVLPTWHDQSVDSFEPVILNGEAVYLEFNKGSAGDSFSIGKGVVIHGQTYNLPKEARAIHDRGLLEIKRYESNTGRTIVGAEPCRLPHVLFLEYVHVRLHSKHTLDGRGKITLAKLQEVVDRINDKTGRELKVVSLPNDMFVLVVPGSWIVQDLTAVDERNRRILDGVKVQPKPVKNTTGDKSPAAKNDKSVRPTSPNGKDAEEPIQIIKYPAAFPSLGSKIVYNRDDRVVHAIIQDFDVVGNGTRVEVLCQRTGQSESSVEDEFLMYSRLYSQTEDGLYNPAIIRSISPAKYNEIKKTYVEDSRDYFVRQMSRWKIWKICSEKNSFRVFAAEKAHREDRQYDEEDESVGKNKSKVKKGKNGEEKERKKNFWLLPSQVVERSDLNIASFETGSVTMADGTTLRIIYRERVDPIEQEECIYLHDIPEDATINSLVFNAVNAHAETEIGKKRVELFFSTKFAEEISVQNGPLFAPRPCTQRPAIDVMNLTWVLGYAGKSHEKNHEEQNVVYWASVPDAFRNFYIWVIRMGNHALFKGKTVSQVRTMFECEEYPCLVDMYNFLRYGYTAENPTRDSGWTHWFLKDIMGIDPHDLA